MKTCVLSESPADEAGVRVLLEGIRGHVLPPVIPTCVVSRGWQSVFAVVPVVLREMYYHTDAEAAVVVVDSDFTEVHLPEHTQQVDDCRVCALQRLIEHSLTGTRKTPGRSPLKTAVGAAVPAIEAWYLFGKEPAVGEAQWITGLQTKKFPYTKARLKQLCYGTDRPSLDLEIRVALQEARRLTPRLQELAAYFPGGFGSLVADVQKW